MSHDTGAGVETLSLDLLAHALAAVRDPRDRKSCRLASRAFARAEAASRRAARVLRRDALPRALRAFPALSSLDLSACASLDNASIAASRGLAVSSAWLGGTLGGVLKVGGRRPLAQRRHRQQGDDRPHRGRWAQGACQGHVRRRHRRSGSTMSPSDAMGSRGSATSGAHDPESSQALP